MQELNARHSASVAAKLDAMKQQQHQQQGQSQGQGQGQKTAPWAQQRDTRPLPTRSLTPSSDFWRQSQQDAQQASQGLQEVCVACR